MFNSEAFNELLAVEEMGAPGLVTNLIADYNRSSRTLMMNLEQALASDDLRLLERSAHSLKSSSRLMGLEQLGEVAYRIEERARDGQISHDDLKILKELYDPALALLNKYDFSRREKDAPQSS